MGGRNLQGRTRQGPKPLGVKSEKGRNLWQPDKAVQVVTVNCNYRHSILILV